MGPSSPGRNGTHVHDLRSRTSERPFGGEVARLLRDRIVAGHASARRTCRRRRGRQPEAGAMTHDTIVALAVLGVVGQVLAFLFVAVVLADGLGWRRPLHAVRSAMWGYELWAAFVVSSIV